MNPRIFEIVEAFDSEHSDAVLFAARRWDRMLDLPESLSEWIDWLECVPETPGIEAEPPLRVMAPAILNCHRKGAEVSLLDRSVSRDEMRSLLRHPAALRILLMLRDSSFPCNKRDMERALEVLPFLADGVSAPAADSNEYEATRLARTEPEEVQDVVDRAVFGMLKIIGIDTGKLQQESTTRALLESLAGATTLHDFEVLWRWLDEVRRRPETDPSVSLLYGFAPECFERASAETFSYELSFRLILKGRLRQLGRLQNWQTLPTSGFANSDAAIDALSREQLGEILQRVFKRLVRHGKGGGDMDQLGQIETAAKLVSVC